MRSSFFALLLAVCMMGLTACDPGQVELTDPGQKQDFRSGNPDFTLPNYTFQDPDVLVSTFEDLLGVYDQGFSSSEDPEGIFNPEADPVRFIKARLHTIGEPDYQPDPYNTDLGGFSGLGMKNWLLAANGACAIAMTQNGNSFFPVATISKGNHGRYDTITELFFGRLPTPAEVNALDTVWEQFDGDLVKQRTAVCTALLGTLEFLSAN